MFPRSAIVLAAVALVVVFAVKWPDRRPPRPKRLSLVSPSGRWVADVLAGTPTTGPQELIEIHAPGETRKQQLSFTSGVESISWSPKNDLIIQLDANSHFGHSICEITGGPTLIIHEKK